MEHLSLQLQVFLALYFDPHESCSLQMSLMLGFHACRTVHGPASSSTVYVIVYVSGTKVEVTKLYTLNLEISHFKAHQTLIKLTLKSLVLTTSLLNCLLNL